MPFRRLRRLHPSAQLPWSEVTAPSIVVASLRFLTTDVALADAATTRFGSTIGLSRVPIVPHSPPGRSGLEDRVRSRVAALVGLRGLPGINRCRRLGILVDRQWN